MMCDRRTGYVKPRRVVGAVGLVALVSSLLVGTGGVRAVVPGPGVIDTAVGGGPLDGSPAANAGIAVCGVAAGGGGVIYASDCTHPLVYRVDAAGNLKRVAGNGFLGFSGDGGPATSARLATPAGLAVDSAGNLYIADGGNQRVRKVAPDGTISTVAGDGTAGVPGSSMGDGGPANSAQLAAPGGVALDSAGNLYIGDTAHHRVRRVVSPHTTPPGVISTVAGTGFAGSAGDGAAAHMAQLSAPVGVALDSAGNLYIADRDNHRVRKVVSPHTTPPGAISTVAGNGTTTLPGALGDGGPAIAAQLSFPVAVALDSAANLYIADRDNHRVRKVTPGTGGTISTAAGNGNAGYSGDGGSANIAELWSPHGVAVDTTGLYIADNDNRRVRKVTMDGKIATVAGNGYAAFSGDGGPAIGAQLSTPVAAAVDTSASLYIADRDNFRVRKVTPGGTITTAAGNGSSGFSGDDGPATQAQVDPIGVAVDSAGNLYIAEPARVRKVTPAGIISTWAGNGTRGSSDTAGPATESPVSPLGVAVDSTRNLYIAEPARVRKVTPAGAISTVVGVGNGNPGYFDPPPDEPATSGLVRPKGVAVGPTGDLYIADGDNRRVRKVVSPHTTPPGAITTVAGNGTEGFSGDGGPATEAMLGNPVAVAVDAAGSLYIADHSNSRVRKVAGGAISTAAGNGTLGFSGDGGPATDAHFAGPLGVAVDPSGNLYIADSGNDRVRVVGAAVPPVFTAHTPSATSVGTPYSYTYTASGQPSPTFAVTSGALPAGLTLDGASGVVSGTPTTAGTATFTVTAANGVAPDATSDDSITVGPATTATSATTPEPTAPARSAPTFIAHTPPSASVGTAYSYTYSASGQPFPSFRVTSGALPAGLMLNSTSGVLSGTPTTAGTASFTVTASNGVSPAAMSTDSITVSSPLPTPPGIGGPGYRLVASDGGIFAFGGATFRGSTGSLALNKPIVGMASTPSGNGYWLVASDGGVFAFGDARFLGSPGALRLNKPIVGIASTPSGNGYRLVASDGGIFAFGDASFRGSTGALRLNQPIVGMASTSSGNGYWLVASDGGIFAFGDATFRGSTGALRLNQPIVGMASTPSGNGYHLVASDGGIFAFGDATFRGSTGALRLNQPIVGMASTPSANGYWLVASDGGIFAFGDAPFRGSTGALRLNKPIVGMAPA